jgi:hypothetical protein
MIAQLSAPSTRRYAVVAGLVGLAILSALYIVGAPALPMSGGNMGLALGFVLVLAPLAIPLAIARPVGFLYALWGALAPLDYFFAARGALSLERLLGFICAGVAVAHILVVGRGVAPARGALAWLGFMLFALVSLFWTMSPDHGIAVLATSGGLAVVGAIVASLRCDRKDLAAMFFGIIAGGVAIAWVEIMTQATGRAHTQRTWVNASLFGQQGNWVDPNHVGASLLLPTIVAVVAALALRGLFPRLLCALVALIMLGGILHSESRGSLIALGIALVYVMVRSRHRAWLIPIVVAGVIALLSTPSVLERFTDPTLAHASGRTDIWKVGIAAFKDAWFAGHGYGSFRDAYQASYLEAFQSAAFHVQVQDSHNILVQVGVELGLIGLALLLFAWWKQFRTLSAIDATDDGWYHVRVAMEAATIALFCNALTLDMLEFKYFWLAITATWIAYSAYRCSPSFMEYRARERAAAATAWLEQEQNATA